MQKDKKRVKVLRIIGECKTGGTETIALNYYRKIDHDKIAMDFLFYGDNIPRFNEELEKNGDKVINVVDYTKNLVKSISQIKKAVKKGNYDIVHSQLNTLNVFPLMGAWLGGAKIRVCANHSTANLKYECKKSIIKYILRPTTKIFATHYAACSKYAGQWCFGKRALKKGKIKVIRNAIDLTDYIYSPEVRKRIREKENWNGRFVIGHIGRFTEQKNHEFLLKIFNEIHEKCPKALLVLVGDGDLMEDVKNKAEVMGLSDSVKFLGIRFDVKEILQGMDVFLFPSLYEGLGNVVIEAQASGMHCVVSDTTPEEVKMTDLVEFVSLEKSETKWADSVLKYQKGYERKDTYKLLVKNGYEISSAAKDLEKYYFSLVSKM